MCQFYMVIGCFLFALVMPDYPIHTYIISNWCHFALVALHTPDSAPFTLAHLSPALMTFSQKNDTFTKCFRALYVGNLPMFVIS